MSQSRQDLGPLSELRVESFSKQIGNFTLKANFKVGVGERTVLTGRSGSGKTTLLRTIAGLEPLQKEKDDGQLWIGNQDITHLTPQDRKIGFVFQEPELFASLTVLENAAFGLKMRGVPKKERELQAAGWLEKLRMSEQLGKSPEKLSGGEKQRVAFIRALIWKPRLLLLDEPFSALDPEMRTDLKAELLELHRLWPAPMILVTHDEQDAQSLATHRLRLKWDPHSKIREVVEDFSVGS
jgi:ABC-type sugar transport system ATPase subunit